MQDHYLTSHLKSWIDSQSKKLEITFPSETHREEMYGRVVKLTEEVGELADAILSMFKQQRKEKQDAQEDNAVAQECADVLITTLLLAHKAGVDIDSALEKKIASVDERFKNIEC